MIVLWLCLNVRWRRGEDCSGLQQRADWGLLSFCVQRTLHDCTAVHPSFSPPTHCILYSLYTSARTRTTLKDSFNMEIVNVCDEYFQGEHVTQRTAGCKDPPWLLPLRRCLMHYSHNRPSSLVSCSVSNTPCPLLSIILTYDIKQLRDGKYVNNEIHEKERTNNVILSIQDMIRIEVFFI